jgi:hypothetical protein
MECLWDASDFHRAPELGEFHIVQPAYALGFIQRGNSYIANASDLVDTQLDAYYACPENRIINGQWTWQYIAYCERVRGVARDNSIPLARLAPKLPGPTGPFVYELETVEITEAYREAHRRASRSVQTLWANTPGVYVPN